MKIEDIKKELEKQEEPLKYLEALLKKIDDKKLIEEIKKLIENLRSKKATNLENIIKHAPRIPIVEEEEKIPRITTITRATLPSEVLQLEGRRSEDYGIKAGKADYDVTTERVKKSLQESHLISEHGFTSSAETRHLIDAKFGEYGIDNRDRSFDENPKYEKFQHVQKETAGLTQLEKEILAKKRFRPDYK